MEKISINKTGLGIFKQIKSQKNNNAPSTNPFGISFRGSVIQADVFEVAKNKESLKDKFVNKSKMVASAVVGNLNSFNDALKSRVNNVVSFGKKMKDNVVELWDKANNIDVTAGLKTKMNEISARFTMPTISFGIGKGLSSKPVSELKEMFINELNNEGEK